MQKHKYRFLLFRANSKYKNTNKSFYSSEQILNTKHKYKFLLFRANTKYKNTNTSFFCSEQIPNTKTQIQVFIVQSKYQIQKHKCKNTKCKRHFSLSKKCKTFHKSYEISECLSFVFSLLL